MVVVVRVIMFFHIYRVRVKEAVFFCALITLKQEVVLKRKY